MEEGRTECMKPTPAPASVSTPNTNYDMFDGRKTVYEYGANGNITESFVIEYRDQNKDNFKSYMAYDVDGNLKYIDEYNEDGQWLKLHIIMQMVQWTV